MVQGQITPETETCNWKSEMWEAGVKKIFALIIRSQNIVYYVQLSFPFGLCT